MADMPTGSLSSQNSTVHTQLRRHLVVAAGDEHLLGLEHTGITGLPVTLSTHQLKNCTADGGLSL